MASGGDFDDFGPGERQEERTEEERSRYDMRDTTSSRQREEPVVDRTTQMQTELRRQYIESYSKKLNYKIKKDILLMNSKIVNNELYYIGVTDRGTPFELKITYRGGNAPIKIVPGRKTGMKEYVEYIMDTSGPAEEIEMRDRDPTPYPVDPIVEEETSFSQVPAASAFLRWTFRVCLRTSQEQ